MAFSNVQRDQINTYLGFPQLWQSANPFLQSAITSIQSVAEGGGQADDSIENAVMNVLAQLVSIDGYIASLEQQLINLAVTEVPTSLSNGATLKQDYRGAIKFLKREGTDLIQQIAIRLGVKPIRPYYFSDGLGEWSDYQNPGWFPR